MRVKLNLTEEDKKALANAMSFIHTKKEISMIWMIRQFLFKFFEKLELKQTQALSELKQAMNSRAKELDYVDEKVSLEECNLVDYPVVIAPNNLKGSILELTGSPDEPKALCLKLEASYKKITGKEAEKITYEDSNKLPEYLKGTLATRTFPCTITYFRFDNEEQQNEFKKMADSLINKEKSENTQNSEYKSEAPRPKFR
ncbi:MAG: hypothetical protein REH83_03765 [Rickettsiella sp.]|nr:hypothetical protein [Rickettsiella sp.]